MSAFANLAIWNNTRLFNQLDWYYEVEINNMPAKYIIARRIACQLDLKESTNEELWNHHKDLSSKFQSLWKEIRTGNVKIESIDTPDTSLMDLNVELSRRMLKNCNMCNWHCGVDRTLVDDDDKAKKGICQLGVQSRVSSWFHHRGEELIYRGVNGSGTIFFTSCSLRCVFCQNGDISKDKENGVIVSIKELAAVITQLREEGAHNINFVGGDPLVHLHTIVDAISSLDKGSEKGVNSKMGRIKADYFVGYMKDSQSYRYNGELNAPMLWNSNFYMSEQSMQILLTFVDIWLPDLKFFEDECARRLSKTSKYFETVSRHIKYLYDNQENFSIRHLIMPNHIDCCSLPILNWVRENIPDALINLMEQYHPDMYSNPNSRLYNSKYVDISRYLTRDEIKRVLSEAKRLELNFELISR